MSEPPAEPPRGDESTSPVSESPPTDGDAPDVSDDDPATRPTGRAGLLLVKSAPWLVLLSAALIWWSTFSSTSAARIAALMTIEPYAFAVQEQLLHNFNESGSFFQTIHKGYDDDWTWSGHRAITLVLNGYLYGMDPDSFGLARLQGLWMLLGCIPAALIGQRVLRSRWGIALGGLLYLASPPVMALALQDYQDLVFATPALVFAYWAMGARQPLWALAGAAVAVLPREECVPMAVIIALIAVPWAEGARLREWKSWLRWKRWAWNVGGTVLVAGVYSWWSATYYPVSDGHDMPLQNAMAGLGGERLFLDGWPYWDRFYVWIFVPLGLLALFSPIALLASLGLVLLHMTVPAGDAMGQSHGVDRSWSGHAHHMGPIMGFMLIANIEGAARSLRGLRHPGLLQRARQRWPHRFSEHTNIRRGMAALPVVVGLLLATHSWVQYRAWADHFNLRLSLTPVSPEWTHPAWTLMEQVPEDAIPIVSRITSPVAANRTVAYTADESLINKAPMKGLAAGTWMLVDSRQTGMLDRALSMPEAEIVDSDGPFILVRWSLTDRDPGLKDWYERLPDGRQKPTQFRKPQPYLGPYSRADQIPGIPPFESSQLSEEEAGSVLSIPLPW